jgi:heat shock protein HslJ
MRTTVAATLLLLLALTGCASAGGPGGPTEETTPVADIDGEWQLTKASDSEGTMAVAGVPVTLAVNGGDVAGQGPCNGYSGSIDIDGDVVAIGPLVQTRMACLDERRTDLERRYIAALESVTETRLGGEILTLTGPDVSLRYTLLPKKSVQ